jgi:ankyrin repeat protein
MNTDVDYVDEKLLQHAKKQEFRYEKEQYRDCHRSFKTSKYEQFKNNNPDRAPNTCRWVLEDEKYSRWLQAEKNDLLWISADPGCGKSVLARSLIERELRSATTHTTCHFFFEDNEEQDSLTTALCAILHQLFSAQPRLLRYAMEAWDKNGQKLLLEVQELWRIFLSAATSRDAHHVTIVIDALDECRENDRRMLIRLLSEFYIKSSQSRSRSSCLKFLVTSRPYLEIEDHFREIQKKLPMMRLRGELENDRIHEEINLVISEKVDALADTKCLHPNTREILKQKLLAMKHRTYLWLHLVMHDIENTFSRSLRPDSASIESLLLPSSVEEAYEKILRRVPKREEETVIQIFHIIIGARRPLTTGEMAMALGMLLRKDLQPFTKFRIAESHLRIIIRDLCGLFVFISHSKIYFIHQTAREFLLKKVSGEATSLWRHSLIPSECEATMTRICVDYLLLDELYQSPISRGDRQRRPKINEKHEIQILLPYSSEHWADHFRNANLELGDGVVFRARRLCRVESVQFRLWFPFFWSTFRHDRDQPDMNDVRLVSFNGHDSILGLILGVETVDLEARDQHKRSALMWAAKTGHEKVVQMLLAKGADVNAQGGYFGNALQAASFGGHDKVVQILLAKGADVNAQGGEYGNALQAASLIGHDKVVEMLLAKGADLNAQGGYFGNALQAALSIGYDNMVQILLDKGADVNAQGGESGNMLQAASHRGHDKVVQILLAKGVDVNAQGGYFGNALQAASFGGHDKVVEMLLAKGAETLRK